MDDGTFTLLDMFNLGVVSQYNGTSSKDFGRTVSPKNTPYILSCISVIPYTTESAIAWSAAVLPSNPEISLRL